MIAIKDMKMPKSCMDCPIFSEDFVSIFCGITRMPLWDIDTNKERHKDCPLIEVEECEEK